MEEEDTAVILVLGLMIYGAISPAVGPADCWSKTKVSFWQWLRASLLIVEVLSLQRMHVVCNRVLVVRLLRQLRDISIQVLELHVFKAPSTPNFSNKLPFNWIRFKNNRY